MVSDNSPDKRSHINSNGSTAAITKYYAHWDYPENAILFKYGITTHLTSATVFGIDYVQYTNTDDQVNSPQLTGMLVVQHDSSPICDDGDSGGPVWTIRSDNSKMLMGVVSGSNYNSEGYLMYVSPLYLALDKGFVPHNMTAVNQYTWVS